MISGKRKEFLEKWVHYYNTKLYNNQDKNCLVGNGKPVWYKKFDESTKRQYYELEDYRIKIEQKGQKEEKPVENPEVNQQEEALSETWVSIN